MRGRFAPPLILGALFAAVPVALLLAVGGRHVSPGATVHFVWVGVTANIAMIFALWLVGIGTLREDARVVVYGSAFAVMAAVLAVHGLATPGVITGANGVSALSGALSLPAGAAVLLLARRPWVGGQRGIAMLILLLLACLIAIAGVSIVGLLEPSLVPSVPTVLSPPALGLLAFGLALFLLLALRAFRTVLLTHRVADGLTSIGIVWLAAALVPALTLTFRDLGWWLGHGFELAGIALLGGSVAYDLRRGRQSRALVGDLKASELIDAEEAFLGSHIRALTARLADKDQYTRGHTRRVAMLAVETGENLRLPPGRLRALAIGALLHDIGKLSIPDRVLKKPGPLTPREYALVQQHPERGARLLSQIGGFSETIRELVASHHERLDGSGYPQCLRDSEISLEVRILGVCDVYDALRSSRVYRSSWTHEQALAHLCREAGALYDPACVAALESAIAMRRSPLDDEPIGAIEPAEPAAVVLH